MARIDPARVHSSDVRASKRPASAFPQPDSTGTQFALLVSIQAADSSAVSHCSDPASGSAECLSSQFKPSLTAANAAARTSTAPTARCFPAIHHTCYICNICGGYLRRFSSTPQIRIHHNQVLSMAVPNTVNYRFPSNMPFINLGPCICAPETTLCSASLRPIILSGLALR
jgi:hypothetical protein